MCVDLLIVDDSESLCAKIPVGTVLVFGDNGPAMLMTMASVYMIQQEVTKEWEMGSSHPKLKLKLNRNNVC